MASITVSPSSSPARSPRASTPDIRTNTLAVTQLPKIFFNEVILQLLQNHFVSFGPINQWVPLPGFNRILIVFEDEDHAEAAKVRSDPIILSPTQQRTEELVLRVYRADPNPLVSHDQTSIPSQYLLHPPKHEKNFLISPPGSPPVGWESMVEDPPNMTPLADDLTEALQRLQVQQESKSSFEVLLEPDEASGVGVYVENCDYMEESEVLEDQWVYGETAPARSRWRPSPVAMPPMVSA